MMLIHWPMSWYRSELSLFFLMIRLLLWFLHLFLVLAHYASNNSRLKCSKIVDWILVSILKCLYPSLLVVWKLSCILNQKSLLCDLFRADHSTAMRRPRPHRDRASRSDSNVVWCCSLGWLWSYFAWSVNVHWFNCRCLSRVTQRTFGKSSIVFNKILLFAYDLFVFLYLSHFLKSRCLKLLIDSLLN